jgi:hypothetical protein|tara:strand:+ start:130 stop:408 length:279 start_codon:yes stop_codon:yes gene_type:complete
MGYKRSGFKMMPKSPMLKALVGKQHNLPEHLKEKILASPAKKYKSDAQRKAVHASKAERSPAKKKGPCWKGYEMVGMKEKGGRKVPNCVPKK